MLYREEIEKQLKNVAPVLSAAFAVRISLRLLPLLSAKKNSIPFAYWKGKEDKRIESVLAVLYAIQIGFNSVLNIKKSDGIAFFDRAASAAASAASAADAADAASAASAAYAAANAANAAAAAADAADAAAAAAAARAYSVAVFREIELDLSFIKKINSASQKQIIDFIASPLWQNQNLFNIFNSVWQQFQQDLLSLDPDFDIWLDWYQNYFNNQQIDQDLLEKQAKLPKEVMAEGPRAIKSYLKQELSQQSLKPLNIVRAIFIGNGEAGKTSLVRKLNNEEVIIGKEKMTPGINIREWPVADTGIRARFWDFGGQVISHSTHQFFLRERCLYIIVLASRNEFNAHLEAEYWLEHVRAFGKDAPVLLVGNKSELMQVNLDLGSLKEKYPNIIDFYPLSCISNSKKFKSLFSVFENDLIKYLKQVGTHQINFTEKKFRLIEIIREKSRKNAFLEEDEFDLLWQQCDINEKEGLSKNDFLGILGNVGEVIHFPQIPTLTSYVLNPRWLTYGVYTLLYSNEIEQAPCGELTEQQVIDILKRNRVEDEKGNVLTFPKNKCSFIIQAMEVFEICYRLQNDPGRMVIPDKLPAKKPDFVFNKEQSDTISFEFVFKGLLPRNIMPNIIVRRHTEIKDNKIVWQNGVLLYNQNHNTLSLIEVDYHLRTLNLWIQGSGAREMLTILDDEILQIINKMDLDFKEMVLLPESALINNKPINYQQEKAPYRQLLQTAKSGIDRFVTESGNKYDINKILGTIMTDSDRAQIHYHLGDSTVGDTTIINGNMVGSSIKSTLTNVQQRIGNNPNTNNEEKQKLQNLITELEQALQNIPKENAEQAETVATMAEQVITHANQQKPNKSLLDITGKGLIDAAKALEKVSPVVFSLATKVVEFVGSFGVR